MKYLPKLSVRDLLWLIVVVALSLLWWRDHSRVANLERALITSRDEHELAHRQAEMRMLEAEHMVELMQQQFGAMRKRAQDSAPASGTNP